MTVPIFTSPGSSEFQVPSFPCLYNSARRQMVRLGLAGSLSSPRDHPENGRGLPKYCDKEESDVFIVSTKTWSRSLSKKRTPGSANRCNSPASDPGFTVQRYRPRIEGLFTASAMD